MEPQYPRYPDITVKLILQGLDAFGMIGKVEAALLEGGADEGYGPNGVREYIYEAMRARHDQFFLIEVSRRWVNVE